MLGKVYLHRKDYRLKEKGSLCYILGKLYYRSGKISPLPLIELNIKTLEEFKDKTIQYDQLAPNCLFAEMTNPDIEFPHILNEEENNHNQTNNSRNKNLIVAKEINNVSTATRREVEKKDIRLMRPSHRTPIFTEGRFY